LNAARQQRGEGLQFNITLFETIEDVLQKGATAKLAVVGVFSVALLLYLPIGLAVSCEWEQLSFAQCVKQGLGESYCKHLRGTGGALQQG
jgi:hypothetical protein